MEQSGIYSNNHFKVVGSSINVQNEGKVIKLTSINSTLEISLPTYSLVIELLEAKRTSDEYVDNNVGNVTITQHSNAIGIKTYASSKKKQLDNNTIPAQYHSSIWFDIPSKDNDDKYSIVFCNNTESLEGSNLLVARTSIINSYPHILLEILNNIPIASIVCKPVEVDKN